MSFKIVSTSSSSKRAKCLASVWGKPSSEGVAEAEAKLFAVVSQRPGICGSVIEGKKGVEVI